MNAKLILPLLLAVSLAPRLHATDCLTQPAWATLALAEKLKPYSDLLSISVKSMETTPLTPIDCSKIIRRRLGFGDDAYAGFSVTKTDDVWTLRTFFHDSVANTLTVTQDGWTLTLAETKKVRAKGTF